MYMHNKKSSSKITSRVIGYDELKSMPKAISSLHDFTSKVRKKSVYDSIYNITVDTTQVLLIEIGNDYHSLTFNILRDSTYTTTDNLVLNWEPYSEYKCFMTKYTLSETEKELLSEGQNVDLTGKESLTHLTEFNPSNIVKSGGNQPNIVKIGDDCFTITYQRVFTYSGIPGQREASGWEEVKVKIDCPEPDRDYSYTLNQSGGGFYIPIMNIENPEPVTIPGTNIGGGSNVFNPVVTSPTIIVKSDCKKLKETLDKNNFRQQIVTLAGNVNDTANEHGVTMDTENNITNLTPAPSLTINLNPTDKYVAFGHIHNDHPDGTYSVFSFADLRTLSTILHNGKIKTSEFVATLSTSKGTHYAFIISDKAKFKKFFYYWNNSMTAQNSEVYLESFNSAKEIEDTFYRSKDALIDQTDTDNESVLSKFLDFIKLSDLGITLFESDATFQNFTVVYKDANSSEIKRQQCK